MLFETYPFREREYWLSPSNDNEVTTSLTFCIDAQTVVFQDGTVTVSGHISIQQNQVHILWLDGSTYHGWMQSRRMHGSTRFHAKAWYIWDKLIFESPPVPCTNIETLREDRSLVNICHWYHFL